MVALTIGVISSGDRDALALTLNFLRSAVELDDLELLVVDASGSEPIRAFVESIPPCRYVNAGEASGSAAVRDLVFHEARGDAVLCCDAGVLPPAGSIQKLAAYFQAHPECTDLLQGPLVNAEGTIESTHLAPVWRDQSCGEPAIDERGVDPDGDAFDIPMQSLALLSCRKSVWPGSNPAFRGESSDEGYVHEKVRRAEGRCLCLPWLRWTRPAARRPSNTGAFTERLRNAVIGHAELGLDLDPLIAHFSWIHTEHRVYPVIREALAESVGASWAIAPSGPRRRDYLPLISCICMTYNRAPDHLFLIEEAIESFLRQTYPNKELILINDTPGQELACDAPGVRVLNVPERFVTLGDKLNAAIAFSSGELIAQWDDDDISLPWRLEFSYDRLGDGDYLNPRRNWLVSYGTWSIDHDMGIGHNASLFTRVAIDLLGGYPPVSLGYDLEMDGLMLRVMPRVVDPHRGNLSMTMAEWYYVYRWGVSPIHVSGNADPTLFRVIGEQPVYQGSFTLHPHWQIDYVAKTRELIREHQAHAAAGS